MNNFVKSNVVCLWWIFIFQNGVLIRIYFVKELRMCYQLVWPLNDHVGNLLYFAFRNVNIYFRNVILSSVGKTVELHKQHNCHSQSSLLSGRLRTRWQTLTLSAESHFPGACRLCLINFVGKQRRGYLGGHPNVSGIHQTSLQRKHLKLERAKRWGFFEGCRQALAETEREGNKINKPLSQSHMIANGLEIWQEGGTCLHGVNCSELIHHSCLIPIPSSSINIPVKNMDKSTEVNLCFIHLFT